MEEMDLWGRGKGAGEVDGRLYTRHEELLAANRALGERVEALEMKRLHLARKNEELETVRKQIDARARDLEMTSRHKSDFLANLFHELRKPLNSILILAKILMQNKDENLTEKQLEFSRTIHGAGSDLLGLINEVLDLANVESGRMELAIEDVNLKCLLSEFMGQFKYVAREKGLALTTTLAENLPDYIRTDRLRLAQIIKNLMANAFKFTAEGEVRISISRPAAGIGGVGLIAGNAVAVNIEDTGIGIPKDKQTIIFEAFRKAGVGIDGKHGGIGIGLFISRELVKQLGGELHVESEEHCGSRFMILLPESHPEGGVDRATKVLVGGEAGLGKEEDPSDRGFVSDDRLLEETSLLLRRIEEYLSPEWMEAVNAPHDGNPVFQDKRVLVVDDDMHNVFALSNILEPRGIHLIMAKNGLEALESLETNPDVHLVLMDTVMPEMGGHAATREIRRLGRFKDLPIIALTSRTTREDHLRCIEAGASDYLTKPVDPDRLVSLLRVWLSPP